MADPRPPSAPAPSAAVTLDVAIARQGKPLTESMIRDALRAGIRESAQLVKQRAQENVSGKVLKRRTGRLFASIQYRTRNEGQDAVRADVGSSAPHGAIHEYGVPHAWTIRPMRGRALRFIAGDGTIVYARGVRHPGLPERSWLRLALTEGEPQVVDIFRTRIAAALKASEERDRG